MEMEDYVVRSGETAALLIFAFWNEQQWSLCAHSMVMDIWQRLN